MEPRMIYKASRQKLTKGGRSGHDQDPLAKDERQDWHVIKDQRQYFTQ
jgi:hypothetical protein